MAADKRLIYTLLKRANTKVIFTGLGEQGQTFARRGEFSPPFC